MIFLLFCIKTPVRHRYTCHERYLRSVGMLYTVVHIVLWSGSRGPMKFVHWLWHTHFQLSVL